MGALFLFRHLAVKETAVGRQKMDEMKGVGIGDVFRAYIPAMKRILKDRLLIVALLLRSLNFIQITIRSTFLAVLVTQRLGFPAEAMALFHTFTAVVMLITLIFISPVLSRYTRQWPISLGIMLHMAATATLILSPPTASYPLLILCAVLIALGTSVATPRIDTLVANTIINEDRSIVNAIMSVILLLLSTPFGYIGGLLSEIDPRFPFLLTGATFFACLLLMSLVSRIEKQRAADS
jgi:Na+/melibiose symporter-like transporter